MSTSRYFVGTVYNAIRGKNINVYIKPYGEGYYRPLGAMEAITANATGELFTRLAESFPDKKLFSERFMANIESLEITFVIPLCLVSSHHSNIHTIVTQLTTLASTRMSTGILMVWMGMGRSLRTLI